MSQRTISENRLTENQFDQLSGLMTEGLNDAVPRILIIEDEPSIQKVIRRILTQGHYENESAYSAEEARALCRQTKYEVVLCDIGLPGESGLSFIRWLTETHPETASIMMSGSNDLDMAEQTLKYGAHSYVLKPFSNRDLLINIAGALIDRQRQIGFQKNTSRLQEEIST